MNTLLVMTCFAALCPAIDPDGAETWWTRGQQAMRAGDCDAAIRCYHESLTADPSLSRNYLSLAAALLQKGERAEACVPLAQYVDLHPEHLPVRAQFAELLARLNRVAEARDAYERYDAIAQNVDEPDLPALAHCHRRLMELASAREDDYAERLHRGIGLYLLARQREALPEGDGELPVEALLFKAAAELTVARRLAPEAARPHWYLFEVWSRLEQRSLALKNLLAADTAAPFSYLTEAEHRQLVLAWHRRRDEMLVRK